MMNLHVPIVVVVGFLSLGWSMMNGEADGKRKGRMSSNGSNHPSIREVEPASARVGVRVKIEGEGFGPEMPVVTFNGVSAVVAEVERDELKVFAPEGATSGPLVVSVGGRKSNAMHFIIEASGRPSAANVQTVPTPQIIKTDSVNVVPVNNNKRISFSKEVQPIFERGCTLELRVQPGNSSASVLYKRVSGTSCGTQMPKKAPPLSSEEIQSIKAWIDQGAENN